METAHRSIESVKAYLLGTLPESVSAAVEQAYFTDRAFFRSCQIAERQLIEEYLAGRLSDHDRQRFEDRYLKVPELSRMIDLVRRERDATIGGGRPAWIWQVAVAAVLICVLGSVAWLYLLRDRGRPLVAQTQPSADRVMMMVRLSPGVTKGSDVRQTQFEITSAQVQFVLDVPGRRSTFNGVVRLSVVGSDGQWEKVWDSRPTASVSVATGQELSVSVDSRILNRGDYILELIEPGKPAMESYAFRVLGRH